MHAYILNGVPLHMERYAQTMAPRFCLHAQSMFLLLAQNEADGHTGQFLRRHIFSEPRRTGGGAAGAALMSAQHVQQNGRV